MSHLTDDLIDHLNIIDVVGRRVQLRKSGSNYTGLCPFHQEKSPSFIVSETKQIYKCFGCGQWGNAIKFVIEHDRLDFWEAVKSLASDYHFDLTPYATSQQSDSHISTKQTTKSINQAASEYFVKTLQRTPKVLNYLRDQRLLKEEYLTQFQIGFAEQWYGLIHHLKQLGYTADEIVGSWLAKAQTGGEIYGFFRERILFPIWDHMGVIVGFSGRSMPGDDGPKYINIAENPLYDKSKILYGLHLIKSSTVQEQGLMIVEWYMDVIWLARLGLSGVATCGTSLTTQHIKLLKKYTERVIFLFDNDAAGQAATMRWLKLCYDQGIYPTIIQLPKVTKDIDELANSTLYSAEEKKMIITQTTDAIEVIRSQILSSHDITSPFERKKAIHMLRDILVAIHDYGVFSLYIEKIAGRLRMDVHILTQHYKNRYRDTQKMRRIDSRDEKSDLTPHKINIQRLRWGLVYQGFVDKVVWTHTQIQEILHIARVLYDALDPKFVSSLDDRLAHDHRQSLLEAQLRREKQREGLTTEKQHNIIIVVLSRELHRMIQTTSLDPSTKLQLLQRLSKSEIV